MRLLDISENSVAAQAQNITITFEEDTSSNHLRMKIRDNSMSMTSGMAARVIYPFGTSRTTHKVGKTGTLLSLMVTNPSINWMINHRVDPKEFVFESSPIVKELKSISLTEPTVLADFREQVETGMVEVPEPL